MTRSPRKKAAPEKHDLLVATAMQRFDMKDRCLLAVYIYDSLVPVNLTLPLKNESLAERFNSDKK